MMGVVVMEDKPMVLDHLGNEYDTITSMCMHYNVDYKKYTRRRRNGYKIEEALTGVKKSSVVYDNLGNVYKNIATMRRHYGISGVKYNSRLEYGYTVEEALLGRKKYGNVFDHLWNRYENVKEMCKAYSIPSEVYNSRVKHGWSIEEALTKPIRKSRREVAIDHLGNKYNNAAEMCRHYNIEYYLFKLRIKHGWGLEEALTYVGDASVTDHLGNVYTSLDEMCNTYGIYKDVFNRRIRNGDTVAEALRPMSTKKKNLNKGNDKIVVGYI